MNRCSCGMHIGAFEVYCDSCKENLTLRDKVIEGIRKDELFGSHYTRETKTDTFK